MLSLTMWCLACLLTGAAIGLVVLWSAPDGWRARAIGVFAAALVGVPVLLLLLGIDLWDRIRAVDATIEGVSVAPLSPPEDNPHDGSASITTHRAPLSIEPA